MLIPEAPVDFFGMAKRFQSASVAAPPVSAEDLAYGLQQTQSLWEGLRGRRIFITGGTGFFGCWLLETFLAANRALRLGARATVLTRSPQQFRLRSPHLAGDAAIALLQGDVRSFDFPAGEFSFVVHAATDSAPRPASSQSEELQTEIVEGTRRCLEFAEFHGTKKLLLTSSGAIYGPQPAEITHIPESYVWGDDSAAPNRAYREGKRLAEELCVEAAQRTGMECKIARCFAFVGPHLPLDAHFAIGNFIRDALTGTPIEIQGDGTPRRSYLYAADLAIWLWTMLFRAPSSRPYNIGSGDDHSILEIAEAVAEVVHPGLPIHVARTATPGASISRYVPSVERAKAELGLEQGIGLHDAIRRTAAWYRT
jgi:dTDP-glucose 4,6-dehydratase